jgi:hypothetical protein
MTARWPLQIQDPVPLPTLRRCYGQWWAPSCRRSAALAGVAKVLPL